jgi:hydroxymethylglutaryl-CoA reductase (NADPH)
MADFPLLSRSYTRGSLRATDKRVSFELRNRLFDAHVRRIDSVAFDDVPVALDRATVLLEDGTRLRGDEIRDLPFPLRTRVHVDIEGLETGTGPHRVCIRFDAEPFGAMTVEFSDYVMLELDERPSVPRFEDDQSEEAVAARQSFLADVAGFRPTHLFDTTIPPEATRGNVEMLVGAAQVPVGLAGPLRINGEHAKGDFYIPMATTEGTLVASYNRGMKALTLAGGVTATVLEDHMQRAPVFAFDSAREARAFRDFVQAHVDDLRAAAATTTSHGVLERIECYLASHLAFLRFDFQTGDAAGQNMTGRATFAACSWLLERTPGVRRFFLEGNLATDKKASHINLLQTRGKRVVAECVIPRHVLAQVMRVEPDALLAHNAVATVGSFLAGVNNNGLHAANGLTALYIACGQDVANVSEGSAGIIHAEPTEEGDLYLSITLPAVIVATHGGGTGLPTQQECLRILDCTEPGSALKLAEIVGATVLAGELSLASAISSMDWVSSHEQYGRNR